MFNLNLGAVNKTALVDFLDFLLNTSHEFQMRFPGSRINFGTLNTENSEPTAKSHSCLSMLEHLIKGKLRIETLSTGFPKYQNALGT